MTSSETPDETPRSSPFIAAETVRDVRPWTLPDLGAPKPAKPAAPEPEAPRLPTAREIEEIEAAAWAEGHQRGLDEGRNTGYETGLAEAREQAARLAAMFEHLSAPVAGIEQTLEAGLMKLGMDIAERLLHRQLELEPGFVETIVRDALDALGRVSTAVRVHVNPDDATLLELLQAAPGGQPWTLIPDPAISRGGCRVETDHGQVDATLETRIGELRRELFGSRA